VIDISTGTLFGAAAGGTNGNGVIYAMSPPTVAHNKWVYSVIYDIPAGYTWNGYLTASGGHLYVTSFQGGAGCASPGCGEVFSLTPPTSGSGEWTPTILHSLNGGSDGLNVNGALAIDSNGVLYGAARSGGTGCVKLGGCGTVFTLTPPKTTGQSWSFSVIYNFAGGKAGQNPGGVVLDKSGNLYGISEFDGSAQKSLFFKLAPPSGQGQWTETALYRYAAGSSDCYPAGGIALDSKGAIYDALNGTCDYAFQLTPSASDPSVWTKTEMHAFSSTISSNGIGVTAPLTVDSSGNLYGTTMRGGIGAGVAYELEPRAGSTTKWNFKILYTLQGDASGYGPNGGLTFDSSGAIYGTTQEGGNSENEGVVFRLSP
jgi:hypothetical protein